MRPKIIAMVLATVFLLLVVTDVAARRSLRIAFFAWSEGLSLGTTSCPGTLAAAQGFAAEIELLGMVFSGSQSNIFLVDAYCQDAFAYVDGANDDEYLNAALFESEEPGLANKIGANEDNAVTARRYTFLDCDRFECFDTNGREPRGFQWAFYFFPGNITLVTLYGGGELSLGPDYFVYDTSEDIEWWNGDRDGYSDQYFCFNGNNYIGQWNGNTVSGGPAAGCVLPPPPPKPESISCTGFEDFNPPPEDPGYCGGQFYSD